MIYCDALSDDFIRYLFRKLFFKQQLAIVLCFKQDRHFTMEISSTELLIECDTGYVRFYTDDPT